MDTISVEIAGEIMQGEPLFLSGEHVALPPELIEEELELVYKLRTPVAELPAGTFLIVELRSSAYTGELVVAALGPRIYVGRYWGKYGLRELRSHDGKTIIENPSIVGSVNQAVTR